MLKLCRLPKSCLLPTLLGGLMVALCGCRSATVQNAQQAQAQLEIEREEIEQIPAPTKSTFMTVHSFDSWQNPVLTIEPSMLELHVLMTDANTTSIGAGGMFRPINARRQEAAIRISSLGEAMSAIPRSCWPYGRVVAVEEAHNTPAGAEPTMRRNMELAISKLNDLGFVVYDLSSGKIQ
ncbi:MAG: hypothetical protein ACLGQX_00595 [Acidobacteriota bacterium]